MSSKKNPFEELEELSRAQKHNELSLQYILEKIDFATETNQKIREFCDKLGMVDIAELSFKYIVIIARSRNGGYIKIPKIDLDETIRVLMKVRDMMKDHGYETGVETE